MRFEFPQDFWNGRVDADSERITNNFASARLDAPHGIKHRFSVTEADGEDDGDVLGRITQPSLFIPEHYEANYPYPLILWLGSSAESCGNLLDLTSQVSNRNYFGASVRTDMTTSAEQTIDDLWMQAEHQAVFLENRIYQEVCELRRTFHIHSERIYVAGFDREASLALQLLLQRPEWFAGAIVFSGRFPKFQKPLEHSHEFQGKRVLMGISARQPRMEIADTISSGPVLNSAGMDVCTRMYEAQPSVPPKLLTDMNRWLMDGIYESNLV